MDRKAILVTAVSTLVAVMVTGLVGYLTGVWSQGSEAIARDNIEQIVAEVLEDELKTDDGMTHAQALAKINGALVRIETKVEGVEGDISDIRNAVRALAN